MDRAKHERHTDGEYNTVPAALVNTVLLRPGELFELLKFEAGEKFVFPLF